MRKRTGPVSALILAAAALGATTIGGSVSAATARTPGSAAGRPGPTGPARSGRASAVLPPGPGVIPRPDQNFPDPFVLRDGVGYYLYSSEVFSRTAPVMVSYTTTFGHWPAPHPAMLQEPMWATPGFTWAPDVRRVGARYVMYYDALAKPTVYLDTNAQGLGAQAQCIGTATSASPGGPFVPSPDALVCQLDHHGSIDPRSVVDGSGDLWLVWKSDDNADFEVAISPETHIFSQRLASDGLGLLGARSELLHADQSWQHGIVEAPQLVNAGGEWWLFYSGGWFNQPYYAVGVARCAGPTGPCTDLGRNPILSSNTQGQGPGEESLVRTADGTWWILYSPWAWGPDGVTSRPVALARVDFGTAGPVLETSVRAAAGIGTAVSGTPANGTSAPGAAHP